MGITRLIEKGLVRRERDAEDRRRLVLLPTEHGMSRLERAPESADVLLLAALGDLGEDDRQQLADWLGQLAEAVSAPAVTAGAGD